MEQLMTKKVSLGVKCLSVVIGNLVIKTQRRAKGCG